MNKTIEWVEDFEEADFGEAELEPGKTLAAVFRVGDRTEADFVPTGDDAYVTLTAVGLPDTLLVPRSAFRVVNE